MQSDFQFIGISVDDWVIGQSTERISRARTKSREVQTLSRHLGFDYIHLANESSTLANMNSILEQSIANPADHLVIAIAAHGSNRGFLLEKEEHILRYPVTSDLFYYQTLANYLADFKGRATVIMSTCHSEFPDVSAIPPNVCWVAGCRADESVVYQSPPAVGIKSQYIMRKKGDNIGCDYFLTKVWGFVVNNYTEELRNEDSGFMKLMELFKNRYDGWDIKSGFHRSDFISDKDYRDWLSKPQHITFTVGSRYF